MGTRESQVWHQSEARTAATVWNWSGKTLSPGALLAVLYVSLRHIFPPVWTFPRPHYLPLGLRAWYCPRNTFCPHLDQFVETDFRGRNVLNELLIVRSYFQSWRCYCDCLPLSQRVPEHIKTGKISISWAVSCFQIRKTLAHRVERILVEPPNSLIGVRKKKLQLCVLSDNRGCLSLCAILTKRL